MVAIIFRDFCAIEEDTMHNEVAKPTHVQHFTRLSYDKMINHLNELEEKNMIHRVSGLVAITAKGKMFISSTTS